MLNIKNSISYNIMKCSNLTRCDKPSLTYFENIYLSKYLSKSIYLSKYLSKL